MITSPYVIVALSSTSYATLLKLLQRDGISSSTTSLRTLVKSISALHSTATTIFALIALTQPWTVSDDGGQSKTPNSNAGLLDDTHNPVIAGKNRLADGITAWELGYLIYDTGALYLEAYSRNPSQGTIAAARRLCRSSPVFVVHHGALIAALLYLQTYIASGREKGVWVIVAFMCMNASNPLLHLRWWNYKRTRKHNTTIDLALGTVFALARFGTVYWVMKRYGQYHSLKPIAAMARQRLQCQVGTGLLTGVNMIWWVALLTQIAHRARITI